MSKKKRQARNPQKTIRWFSQIRNSDVPLVGGKNASLGEMYSNLSKKGILVPNGFAITAQAYRYFLEKGGIKKEIKKILADLNTHNLKNLQERGKAIRELML